MRVLNLVTNEDAQFFRKQVATLEQRDVESTTASVPGENLSEAMTEDEDATRSVFDYLRFYPTVLRESMGEYDLVHANYGLTAPMAVAQPYLPVVVSLWGSDLMGKYGPMTKQCVRFADDVIVMSDVMAAELDCDAHVIPHGVDLDAFAPMDQAAARAEIGWPEGEQIVLFPYPPKREVKNYSRAEGIVEDVAGRVAEPVSLRTATDVPHERMPYYMNAADALLLTSRREGSPNTVKEAIATNLPVVATDVGDVATRLADVDPSVVSEDDRQLRDGLAEMLSRGERSDGRHVADNISLDRMAEDIHDVYRSVLES
jgi:glycosyltransferase involved in cell wall biosynthesis